MEHFLWLAMGRPDRETFKYNDAIHQATEDQKLYALLLSFAAREVDLFRTGKVWDNMIHGSGIKEEACEIAQQKILEAYKALCGFYTYSSGQTFDTPMREVVRRLAKNGMLLLIGQTDREAIARFVGTLFSRRGNITNAELKIAYYDLREKSEDAAKLLAFAVGWRTSKNPKAGETHILNTDNAKTINYIYEIANEISIFDNGTTDAMILPSSDT